MAVPAQSTPQAAPMSDESGRTGANAQTADPNPTPSSSPDGPEQDARGPDFFREAFTRLRSQNQETHDLHASRREPAPQAPPVSDGSRQEPERSRGARRPKSTGQPATTLPDQPEQKSRQTQPSSQPGGPSPDANLTLTQDQFNRRVQSEVDRVLAKREHDERVRTQQAEEARLRRDDPFEYVRTVEKREAEQAQIQQRQREATTLLEQQIHQYDRNILDPLLGALPEPARKQVLESVRAEGIPGRAAVAKNALGALRSIWTAEGRETARSALMKDQTFIKEVLARYAGQPQGASNGNGNGSSNGVAYFGGPEVVTGFPPASAARPRDDNEAVNDWMRSASTAVRSVSGGRR
jgi:hypothetical protein